MNYIVCVSSFFFFAAWTLRYMFFSCYPPDKRLWFWLRKAGILSAGWEIHVWLLVRWKNLPVCGNKCCFILSSSLSQHVWFTCISNWASDWNFPRTEYFFNVITSVGDGIECLRGNTSRCNAVFVYFLVSTQHNTAKHDMPVFLNLFFRCVFLFSNIKFSLFVVYLYFHRSYDGAHGVTSWLIRYADEGEPLQISSDHFCWGASNLTSKTGQCSQTCIF